MGRRKIIQVGNICALCQETYPRNVLYTCGHCGLMYCGNCVLFENNYEVICLRCATRRVSPKASGSKYMKLSVYLAKRPKALKEITLSFHKIEEIIGEKLPESAYRRKSWWSNVRGRMPSEAWMTVGWTVKEVNVEEGKVTFIRENAWTVASEREKNQEGDPSFKVLAFRAKARSMKRRRLSKTRIAILQARLKNIERERRMSKSRRKRRAL